MTTPAAAPTTTAPTSTAPTTETPTQSVAVRVAVDDLAPAMSRAMASFAAATRRSSIAASLLDLVSARVSQVNGCAYCVDTHSADALAEGEDTRRVLSLSVWRETPFFTPRERAALALAEAATRCALGPVPAEVVEEAAAHFSPTELAELLWVVAAINAWNVIGATAHPWPLD